MEPKKSLGYVCIVLVSGLGLGFMACGGGGGGGTIPPLTVENGVAAGDVNKDGLPDLVLAATYLAGPPPHPGNVYIFLQDELNPGVFFQASKYGAGSDPWGLEIADINGDGFNDIITANSNSDTISILFQDPRQSGEFFAADNFPCGRSPYAVAVGNLNNDDKPDIAIANYDLGNSVTILLQGQNQGPTVVFLPAAGLSTGEAAESVAVGDLNNDGLMDIAVDGAASVFIMMQDKGNPGEFLAPVSFSAGQRPSWVAIHDLNGDGLNDLAVANAGSSSGGTNASVTVLLQNSDQPGSFLAPKNYATADGARKVVVADFNDDNRPDLAVAAVAYQAQAPGAVAVLLQSSSSAGTFLQTRNYYAGFTPNFVAAADLDADGKVDIAVNEGPGILFQDPDNKGVFLPITVVGDFFDQ